MKTLAKVRVCIRNRVTNEWALVVEYENPSYPAKYIWCVTSKTKHKVGDKIETEMPKDLWEKVNRK